MLAVPARLGRALATLALILAWSCTPSTTSTELDRPELSAIEPSRSIDRKHLVPEFRIETVAGNLLDSRELIGQRSFMLVYFATWCEVCRMKLPMVHSVLTRYEPDIDVYGVVMDDKNTWHRVPGYLAKYDIDFELIRGDNFPRFAQAYSPSGRVPAVTIIGQDGYLIEYQHGYSRSHFQRLVQALEATLPRTEP